MKVAAVDISGIAARVVEVLPAEQLYRSGSVVAFESLRKIDLINIAVIDITSYFLDCFDKKAGASVRQIIACDRGDDGVFQFQEDNGLSHLV